MCVHVCVRVHLAISVYSCVGVHACVQRPEANPGCDSSGIIYLVSFEARFLSGLELAKYARLSGQPDPGIGLSAALQCWDYRYLPPHLDISLFGLWA